MPGPFTSMTIPCGIAGLTPAVQGVGVSVISWAAGVRDVAIEAAAAVEQDVVAALAETSIDAFARADGRALRVISTTSLTVVPVGAPSTAVLSSETRKAMPLTGSAPRAMDSMRARDDVDAPAPRARAAADDLAAPLLETVREPSAPHAERACADEVVVSGELLYDAAAPRLAGKQQLGALFEPVVMPLTSSASAASVSHAAAQGADRQPQTGTPAHSDLVWPAAMTFSPMPCFQQVSSAEASATAALRWQQAERPLPGIAMRNPGSWKGNAAIFRAPRALQQGLARSAGERSRPSQEHAAVTRAHDDDGRTSPSAARFSVDAPPGSAPIRVHYALREGRVVFEGYEFFAPAALQREGRPATLLPDPDAWRSQEQGWFGFVIPSGGEAARELPSIEADAIGRELVARISAQLRAGPESLASAAERLALNIMLARDPRAPETAVTPAVWYDLLAASLARAAGSVPVFGREGMRSVEEVSFLASRQLGLTADQAAAWDDHFGSSGIARWIEGDLTDAPLSNDEQELRDYLLAALDAELALRATGLQRPMDCEGMPSRRDECAVQWSVARISLEQDPDRKVAEASRFILDLAQQGSPAAGRALALIVVHSQLAIREQHGDALAPRWTGHEAHRLFEAIMLSGGWSLVGHHSFRRHLSERENERINHLVASANVGSLVSELRRFDLTQASERQRFWDLIDASGRWEIFLDLAIARMITAAEGYPLR